MSTGRDDIELDGIGCTTCGGNLIIIRKHGPIVQHEDASVEADHSVTLTEDPADSPSLHKGNIQTDNPPKREFLSKAEERRFNATRKRPNA